MPIDSPDTENQQSPPAALKGWVPIPDPTTLTTQIVNQSKTDLRREAASLRELIEARLHALEGVVGAVGSTIERMPNAAAHEALQQQITHLGVAIKEQIGNLQALHEERFAAIQQQFDERDVRGEQEKKASKEALDAALLAQKESVSQQNDANTTAATKSETSFTKQIDQIGTLIATLEKSLTDRITELKERIDRGEGVDSGRGNQIDQARLNTGQWIGIFGVVFLGLAILISTAIAVFH